MYQHDARAKHLRDSLDDVVQSCVSFVGVELNSASTPLLRYVSGMNQLTARRVYEHRQQHGPFRSRQAAAGSERARQRDVRAGGRLLENRRRRPAARRDLDSSRELRGGREAAGRSSASSRPSVAGGSNAARIRELVAPLDRAALAAELGIGQLTLDDMIEALCRPGRDPREDLPPPIFRKDVVKFEDLQAGMELRGTVLNVVDFGAFVDVGLSDSGLIHISQLSAGYVRDPHDVVAVGDQVRAWVSSIDKDRRRVALTMIQPGTERPQAAKTARASVADARTDRTQRGAAASGAAPPSSARKRRAARQRRPPRASPRETAPRRSSRAAAAPAAYRRVRKASAQKVGADYPGDGGRQGIPALVRRPAAISQKKKDEPTSRRAVDAAAMRTDDAVTRAGEWRRESSKRSRISPSPPLRQAFRPQSTMSFRERLQRATERGKQVRAAQLNEAAAKALSEEECRRRHSQYRLALTEHIEKCLSEMADNFPGFRLETIVDESGWGAAVSRDDIRIAAGGAATSSAGCNWSSARTTRTTCSTSRRKEPCGTRKC